MKGLQKIRKNIVSMLTTEGRSCFSDNLGDVDEVEERSNDWEEQRFSCKSHPEDNYYVLFEMTFFYKGKG